MITSLRQTRVLRFTGLLASLVLAASAGPAFAQLPEKLDPGVVARLGNIVRWSGVVTSLFVMAGAWMLLRILNRTVMAFSSDFSTRRLTLQKLNTILQFVIYVITTIVVVLLSFRIDETVLALIGGTAAVAVGFAMKDLVASFIAGIIVMIDRPFQVGDRVSFGGEYGDITAIGLRSVRMQTLDDNTITIPNSKFLTEMSSSGNYGALDMQVAMDFIVSAGDDFDAAREIITEAALSSRYVYLSKPIVVLVTQWHTEYLVGVRLRLKAYVLDTRHEKAFETDVNLRVLRSFREHGIGGPSVPLAGPGGPGASPFAGLAEADRTKAAD